MRVIGLQSGFFDRAIVAGKFSARPYQQRADANIDAALTTKRSALYVAATGTGKTVTFCMQAMKRGGCLVIAHRDSLIRQAAEKLQLATGEPIAIEKAQERAHFGARYLVASVQTLKAERLKRFAMRFPDVSFIIVDEAHRAVARSYRAILDAWPNAKVLGVTATPDRSDGVGMKAVFDVVADSYDIIDATADGWLTPLKFVPVQSDIDLDALKVTKQSDGERDFDQSELDDAVSQESGRVARAVIKALDDLGPTSRMIAFTPGVKTAHLCSNAANDLRPGIAGVVDGEMPDVEKRVVMEAHRKGNVRVVFNCNVLSEGHDDPTLTAVFDASPSKSRLRVSQRWGRATRLWPDGIDHHEAPEARRAAIAASPKPWAVIFDLVANSSKHDVVVDGVDLLAGKDIPENVRQAAKKVLREEGGTVDDALEKARKQLRAIAAAKRLAGASKVTMGTPRTIFDRAGVTWLKRSQPYIRPEDHATEAQIWKLNERGIPMPDGGLSKRMFKRLLSTDVKREAKGLCRLGGVHYLKKQFGFEAWSLTGQQARRLARAAIGKWPAKLSQQEVGDAIEREVGEDD